MRKISLQSIDLVNFRSFRSAHLDLRRSPGLRLIFGVNGEGKSSIWNAVCFCLTGRSIGERDSPGGLRASDLICDQTVEKKKSMTVALDLLVDDTLHTIKRTYPPERVHIDGEQVEQRQVDELIGLSRDRLLASVLYGQDKPLFIDLPIPERGDLLDEVLGLGFWIRAANLASSRWTAAGLEMQKLQREVARLEGALGELPSEDVLGDSLKSFEDKRSAEVEEQGDIRRTLAAELRQLRRFLRELGQGKVGLEEELNRQNAKLREKIAKQLTAVALIERDQDQLVEHINLLNDKDECPTCGQGIDADFAYQHRYKLDREIDKNRIALGRAQKRLEVARENMTEVSNELRVMSDNKSVRHRVELEEVNKRGQVSIVDNRIQVLASQVNPYEEQLRIATERRISLGDELDFAQTNAADLSAKISQLDFWRQGFRRVRVFCLARVLRELEYATMSEARSLGLVGWNIGFACETETKSGTAKLGVQAIVTSPEARRSFAMWSPGQKQRIRWAVSMGLGALIQRYSGVSYDLEAYDEPSAWLSNEGIDDLFESLAERARARGKSIWVCDPRAGLGHGGFDEVWNVKKTEKGSIVEVVR